MNEFKRAWEISKLGGKTKMVITGTLPLIVTVMLVNLQYQSKLNISILGAFSIPAVCGNFDVSGHCKAVRTSPLRRYIYGKFEFIMTLAAAMLLYAADIASRLGAEMIRGGGFSGKESVMAAEFLVLGMICMGLAGLGRYGAVFYIGGTILSVAVGFGALTLPLLIPEPLAGNPFLELLWGAIIIILGAAAQYFIRQKTYERMSSAVLKINGEEITGGAGG